MTGRAYLVRGLAVIGLLGLVIGTLDPLEGSVLIVAGVALITLAAFLGGSRHRSLLAWSLVIIVLAVAGMWISSLYGGFGGDTGRSLWWLVPVLAPYILGWLLAVVGTVRLFRETFRRGTHPGGEADANGRPRRGAVK
ncbi:hypothetical protein [Corynebacterium comes]|uniref:hypothetical protein n=1 Tax=Corynebacterium comes TaxID=2675218 RepID=UPI0012E2BD27|nr:hypothetical protein [Corynebacterium comes]